MCNQHAPTAKIIHIKDFHRNMYY